MSRRITPEAFLKDVATHVMTIEHDAGEYRSIRFGRPGTSCMHFRLTTWPGHLCYSGDMGTYVFSRLRDMFEFFRSPRGELDINLGYWGEKVEAEDRDRVRKYDAERALSVLNEWLDNQDADDDVRAAVEDDIHPYLHDGEYTFRNAVDDFDHDGFHFIDFFEADLTEYSYRFNWCCYAMVWGIAKYDAAKNAPPAPEPTP